MYRGWLSARLGETRPHGSHHMAECGGLAQSKALRLASPENPTCYTEPEIHFKVAIVRAPAAQAVGFDGLLVVAFESRLGTEMASLISKLGGVPQVAPALKEVPLEENSAALQFAEELFAGRVPVVIFMTGVGTRALAQVLATRYPHERFVEALSKVAVVARGPKPVKALKELGVPITITVPEPNTWREVLAALDRDSISLDGKHVAVQEYGIPNLPFLSALDRRGAVVLRVPVYRWTLPDDVRPLAAALDSILEARASVVLFTNAAQVENLFKMTEERGLKDRLLDALPRLAVGSIGPTCTEIMAAFGIRPDFEPEVHKMGMLVHEAARRASEILSFKSSLAAATPVRVFESAPTAAEPGEVPWFNSLFMKACRREPVERTPIWLMRQAGRFMKEYRDIRDRVPFLELCKSPDLAAEITVMAVEKLGVDAGIIFADLLPIVEPLGFELSYEEGDGPVVRPALREAGDLARLREVEPKESLEFHLEGIRRARAALDPRLPLLGFAAAPFTLASYLIEGGGSKDYARTKAWMFRDPGAWRTLAEHLARNLARLVNRQIEAGVQAVQVFDTWVGCLGPAEYREFVEPHTRAMLRAVTPGVPIIHFGVGTSSLLEAMRDAGGDVIGLDWRVELDEAWARLGPQAAIQGNLDPAVLLADQASIRHQVERILRQAAGRPGHIFNLGHGVLPNTPFENARALVEMVKELGSGSKDRG